MLLMIKSLLLRTARELLLRLLFRVRLLRRALRIALPEARNRRRTHGALRLWVTHYKKLGNNKICYGDLELEGQNTLATLWNSKAPSLKRRRVSGRHAGRTHRSISACWMIEFYLPQQPKERRRLNLIPLRTHSVIWPAEQTSMLLLNEPVQLNQTIHRSEAQLTIRLKASRCLRNASICARWQGVHTPPSR